MYAVKPGHDPKFPTTCLPGPAFLQPFFLLECFQPYTIRDYDAVFDFDPKDSAKDARVNAASSRSSRWVCLPNTLVSSQ